MKRSHKSKIFVPFFVTLITLGMFFISIKSNSFLDNFTNLNSSSLQHTMMDASNSNTSNTSEPENNSEDENVTLKTDENNNQYIQFTTTEEGSKANPGDEQFLNFSTGNTYYIWHADGRPGADGALLQNTNFSVKFTVYDTYIEVDTQTVIAGVYVYYSPTWIYSIVKESSSIPLGETWYSSTSPSTQTQFTIIGLEPSTTYDLWISTSGTTSSQNGTDRVDRPPDIIDPATNEISSDWAPPTVNGGILTTNGSVETAGSQYQISNTLEVITGNVSDPSKYIIKF